MMSSRCHQGEPPQGEPDTPKRKRTRRRPSQGSRSKLRKLRKYTIKQSLRSLGYREKYRLLASSPKKPKISSPLTIFLAISSTLTIFLAISSSLTIYRLLWRYRQDIVKTSSTMTIFFDDIVKTSSRHRQDIVNFDDILDEYRQDIVKTSSRHRQLWR